MRRSKFHPRGTMAGAIVLSPVTVGRCAASALSFQGGWQLAASEAACPRVAGVAAAAACCAARTCTGDRQRRQEEAFAEVKYQRTPLLHESDSILRGFPRGARTLLATKGHFLARDFLSVTRHCSLRQGARPFLVLAQNKVFEQIGYRGGNGLRLRVRTLHCSGTRKREGLDPEDSQRIQFDKVG